MTNNERTHRVDLVHRQFPDVIESKPGGRYLVASASIDGAWWLLDGPTCSCPRGVSLAASGSTAMCRHQRRLLSYITAMNEATKRPTMPPNVAAFVE